MDLYGLGGVRTTESFFDLFDIDVVKKTTNRDLCKFVVGGIMHILFTKSLRSDGMGIDYSSIDFQLKTFKRT